MTFCRFCGPLRVTLRLDDYVASTARLPWAWGRQDCTIWAADWCMIRWGFDPAADFRGTYDSREGAEALTAIGLIDTVEPCIPLLPKLRAADGDIGVIEVNGRQVAAIRSGHWLFRTFRGVGMTDRPAIIAWGD